MTKSTWEFQEVDRYGIVDSMDARKHIRRNDRVAKQQAAYQDLHHPLPCDFERFMDEKVKGLPRFMAEIYRDRWMDWKASQI